MSSSNDMLVGVVCPGEKIDRFEEMAQAQGIAPLVINKPHNLMTTGEVQDVLSNAEESDTLVLFEDDSMSTRGIPQLKSIQEEDKFNWLLDAI